MSKYKEIQKKIEALQIEMLAEQKIEAPIALAECKRIIKEFGFTAKDLDLEVKGKRKSITHPVLFRNANGDEFTNFGKRPQWILDLIKKHGGENAAYKAELETYRIKSV